MKFRYFIFGIAFALLLGSLAYLNKSNIRPLAQPIINFIQKGSLKIENINIEAERSIIDSNNLVKSLTTNNLPLNFEYIDLNDSNFKKIGHIESLSNSIILMDRIGVFYKFFNKKIIKLDASIPNNIDSYYAEHGIGQSDMRAYSFVIDCKNSKIYASFMKYLSNNIGKLSLQTTSFDCLSSKHFTSDVWFELYSSEELGLSYIKGSHNGGGAITHDENNLYLSIGFTDGISNKEDITSSIAQDMSSTRGKILRINKANASVDIFSKGHRNLQDLIILNDKDKIYGIEQGPQGGDELNLIKYNKNYGWPIKTFGTRYGAYDHEYIFKNNFQEKSYEDPIFSFVPSIAGCSLHEINNFHESWDSDILIGSLKARSIYRLKIKNDKVLFSEHIWIGKRIRSLAQVKQDIYAITDDNFLIKINVDTDALVNNNKYDDSYAFNPSLGKCLSCHGLAETNSTSVAPSLKNIIGRDIASTNFLYYSESLSSLEGQWDDSSLRVYLENPELIAPESSMPKINLESSEIDAIIMTLNEYSK